MQLGRPVKVHSIPAPEPAPLMTEPAPAAPVSQPARTTEPAPVKR